MKDESDYLTQLRDKAALAALTGMIAKFGDCNADENAILAWKQAKAFMTARKEIDHANK